MWLLDANLDIHLAELLTSFGVQCETTRDRGWKTLRNGDLVSAAVNAGFHALLTRDRLFAESTARPWRQFPDFAIVIVTLPQLSSQRFLEGFAAAWARQPVVPSAGKLVHWP